MTLLRTSNLKLREFLAEFFGTLTLTCLGCSANVVAKLRQLENGNNKLDMLSAPMAWSLSVVAAIYISSNVSGGHLNPAVSLGLASVGKFHWKKLTHYFMAQYLGAFFGALLTYIIYQESLGNKTNETLGLFGTEMRSEISLGTAMMDQIIATAFFLIIICAIMDERNIQISKGFIPFAIGFVNLGAIQLSFGYNCGSPLNPARDLSPRIMSSMFGWGQQVFFNGNHYYFWIPVIACHIGGVIGCWIYRLMIENHWPNDSFDLNYTNNNNDKHESQTTIIEINNTKNSNNNGINSPGICVTGSPNLELQEA